MPQLLTRRMEMSKRDTRCFFQTKTTLYENDMLKKFDVSIWCDFVANVTFTVIAKHIDVFTCYATRLACIFWMTITRCAGDCWKIVLSLMDFKPRVC